MIREDELVLGAKLVWASRLDPFTGVITLFDRHNDEIRVDWLQVKTGIRFNSQYYSVRALCDIRVVSRVYESTKGKVLSDYL